MRIRAQDRVDNETEYEREARLADMRIRAQQRHEQQCRRQSLNTHAQH